MDSSLESEPRVVELPVSPEGKIAMVERFFDSDAFLIAERHFKERINAAWAISNPGQYSDREDLYYMQLGWEAMKEELKRVLTIAEGDKHRADTRSQWDMEQRRGVN